MTSRLRGAIAALTLTAAIAAGVGLVAPPAFAADPGPGYDYQGDPHSHLGGYRTADGSIGYCIDAGRGSPLGGATSDQGLTDAVKGRSAAAMRQLSWVLGRYGNTRDDDTAAAVALVVWGLADPEDHAARGGDGFVLTRAPAAARQHILELTGRIRAQAKAFFYPAPGTATLELTLPHDDPRHGLLAVTVEPGAATGTITLTNAVFSDTGLPSRDDVPDGALLALDTVAPAGALDYDVSAEGAFHAGTYPDGTVHVWATPGAQTLASAGGRLPLDFAGSASVHVRLPTPTPQQPDLPRVAG